MVARGVVLLLVGGFLTCAGARHNANAARGIGGAVAAVHTDVSGRTLPAVTAAGVLAYGAHNLLLACFRRPATQRTSRPHE